MTDTHVDHLQEQLRKTTFAAAPELKAAITAVAAEAHQRLAAVKPDDSAYYRRLTSSVVQICGHDLADVRIGCLLDASQFFYLVADTFKAIEASSHALELARDAGLRHLERKVQTALGICYADTMNLTMAFECYAAALAISEDLADEEGRAILAVNTGLVLTTAAQYTEANECFRQALVRTAGAALPADVLAVAYAGYASCLLHVEDAPAGLVAIEKAIAIAPESKTTEELVAAMQREVTYVRLLLAVGRLAKARERAVVGRALAERAGTPRAETLSGLMEAICDVGERRFDLGISRLTRLLERSRMLRILEATQREILTELSRSYELAGQPDRALNTLRELAEVTRKSWQDHALEHHRQHMERLGVFARREGADSGTFQRREIILKGKVAERDLFAAHTEMLERLAITAELRDDPAGEHIFRVGRLASLIAQELDCDEESVGMIELAARLHDIGKMGVPDDVLLKPGPLTEGERDIMRMHSLVGAELLSKSNVKQMQMAEEIARHHHERWDGSGYPGNLSGSAIPHAARITAIAEVFDALTHDRPHRNAWTVDDALAHIERESSRQFDPQLVEVAIPLIQRLRRERGNLDAFLGIAALDSPLVQARSQIRESLKTERREEAKNPPAAQKLNRIR